MAILALDGASVVDRLNLFNLQVWRLWLVVACCVCCWSIQPSYSAVYLNKWAVQIDGGQQVADEIASSYGFRNLGQVDHKKLVIYAISGFCLGMNISSPCGIASMLLPCMCQYHGLFGWLTANAGCCRITGGLPIRLSTCTNQYLCFRGSDVSSVIL